MRILHAVVIGILVFGGTSPTGETQRGGRGGDDRKTESVSHQPTVHADVRIVFSSEETQIVREYYSARYRNLPPGLQKKLARGGQLPPGWQKKVEAFPPELDRRLPRLPEGHHRGVVDGHAVIYLPGGGIVDAAVLF